MIRRAFLLLSVLAFSCDPGIAPDVAGIDGTLASAHALDLAAPLALSEAEVISGSALTASVTYLNTGAATVSVSALAIEATPEGATAIGGPSETLSPVIDQRTVAPGETVTLTSSRLFSDQDATGTWAAYATARVASGAKIVVGSRVTFRHHRRDAGTTAPPDAGTPSRPDAGSPAPLDAGSPPVPDAGSPPVPDAGTPPNPGTGALVEPVSPGPSDVSFTVRADGDVHPISPLIYGVNQVTDLATTQRGVSVVRAGGNRWTAYNWENNASNAGTDYYNQNDTYLVSDSSAPTAPGEAVRLRVDGALAHGAAALITIPIQGYVAADTLGNGDVNQTGNYLQTRFKQLVARKNAPFTLTPDTTDGTVYQDEFANWLQARYPAAFSATAPRILFTLDNEPDLWFSTHPRIQPGLVTPEALIAKNIEFATAVKSVIPTATVTGFVSYGYYGFMALQGQYAGDFTAYYLDQMRLAGASAGKRLIDVLDLHWYPEATGGGVRITGTDTSAASVAARVQAPRSLWDPTYSETSWVASSAGGPLALIPAMKARIAAHYPGTKLAFTEYSYGASADISGAIAQADVLGIFGREDVYLATYWDLSGGASSMVHAAIRAFTSFDEAGAHFGDTSVRALTSNTASTSVYASIDAANHGRMVIVAINKTGAPLTAALSLAAYGAYASARVYRLTSGATTLQSAGTVAATTRNGFFYQLPAYSVSVLVPQ